ncbi:MAG: aminotransferase class III-fold pyridoxal phosphate-dependent enzyme [Lentisphaeria bacterium]|nr:aminotransferase class III-fold pyridoxal phosphate-dependent enzyme [Lentisphaeria bacterium]
MLKNLCLSLSDLVGADYAEHVCRASAALGLGDLAELRRLANDPVDFFPEDLSVRLDALLDSAGGRMLEAFSGSSSGAGTRSFDAALQRQNAPLSGLGYYRLVEDGCLAIMGKSEHYQASLGHNFPGYQLLQHAAAIGITNITHNNTRGHVTRLLERELVRVANGLAPEQQSELDAVLASKEPHVLNRVINLETGSLACEAAFKMMLARFYRLQETFPEPVHAGKTPVFLVMGDYKGGLEANYHGTTIMTQMLRGMWPGLYEKMAATGLFKVVPVAINDPDSFAQAVEKYHCGKCRVAGFLHELVLMNYGGIRLKNDWVENGHRICQQQDIPVFIDEIQSCMWSPEIFLFREYGSHPDFVSLGKGFPGGMYPASRVLTTAAMDNLNQFGALVTNGQEELASLANLITLRFAEANAAHTRMLGQRWQELLQQLAGRHPGFIRRAEGDGLLGTLLFYDADQAVAFCRMMNEQYRIDVSAQTYKADCPPAALTKLPLIASEKLLEFIADKMEKALAAF